MKTITEVNLFTGYFANQKTSTKVHIVKDNKPVCGAKIGADMKFQLNAHGAYMGYVECRHCKKIMMKPIKQEIKLETGTVVKLWRKPTTQNDARIVFRGIKSVDYKKKVITCDDNIVYKFRDIINN